MATVVGLSGRALREPVLDRPAANTLSMLRLDPSRDQWLCPICFGPLRLVAVDNGRLWCEACRALPPLIVPCNESSARRTSAPAVLETRTVRPVRSTKWSRTAASSSTSQAPAPSSPVSFGSPPVPVSPPAGALSASSLASTATASQSIVINVAARSVPQAAAAAAASPQ